MPHEEGLYGTPDYEMEIEIDDFDYNLVAPSWSLMRSSDEMSRLSTTNSNVIHIDGIGWRLMDFMMLERQKYEVLPESVTDDMYYDETTLEMPTGVVASNPILMAYSNPLPGVVYVIADQAVKAFSKAVNAAHDWDNAAYRHTTDQAAFPGPDLDETITDMDRMLVSKDPHLPDQGIQFQIEAPSAMWDKGAHLCSLYFSGPAGSDGDGDGCGQYAIAVMGGGHCYLFENRLPFPQLGVASDPPDWIFRRKFLIPAGDRNGSKVSLSLSIVSNATRVCDGKWNGNRLVFIAAKNKRGVTGDGFSFREVLTAMPAIDLDYSGEIYSVPRTGNEVTIPAKVRLDIRRDCRATFMLRRPVLASPGTLVGDPFAIDHFPVTSTTKPRVFGVRWRGDKPAGSTVDVNVFVAGHVGEPAYQLSFIEVNKSTCQGDYVWFEMPPSAWRHLQVVYTLTKSTDGRGPTIASEQYYLAGAKNAPPSEKQLVAPLGQRNTDYSWRDKALISTNIMSIETSGPTDNADADSFTVTIGDPARKVDALFDRIETPISIVLRKKSTGDRYVLRRGIITGPQATFHYGGDLPDPDKTYPAYNHKTYRLSCQGEQRRVQRRLFGTRSLFMDPTTNKPYNVGKKLREILEFECGYQSDQIIIPSNALTLFVKDNDDKAGIEPSEPIFPVMTDWARDYYGGFFIFDTSTHVYGSWRLLQRRRPPLTPLIRFEGTSTLGSRAFSVAPPEYAKTTVGGQEVVHMPILSDSTDEKGTETWEGPDCNLVYVVGGGTAGGKQSATVSPRFGSTSTIDSKVSEHISQVAVNVRSFNALGLGSGHANYPTPDTGGRDFIGEVRPVHVYMASLSTQEAVDWMTRRIYDFAAHARTFKRFKSWMPLIVDSNDPFQIYPRMPRIYDPVEVYDEEQSKWVSYVIADCKMCGLHNNLMMMEYLIVRTTAWDKFAYPFMSFNAAKMFRNIMAGAVTTGAAAVRREQHTWKDIEVKAMPKNAWSNLPALAGNAIQNLDPDDANFGKFNYMAGYDPIG